MVKQTNILVIEDNEDIRGSISEILELAGYAVTSAENGRVGLEKAIAYVPDLILCDIMMPELDGYGVLHILSKNILTKHIPFIFLSAKAERADMRKGMNLGADDYLIKPFGDLELLNAVESRLLKNQKATTASSQKTSFETLLNDADTAKLITSLSVGSRTKKYQKKQIIYMEGDESFNVFLIQSGSVRTYMKGADGNELATGLYMEGDFFGYEAALLNKEEKGNAQALEAAELLVISKDEFSALLFKNPAISRRFIELLSGRIEEKQERLLKLAYNSVRKRIADALVALAEKQAKGQNSCTIAISREDLAAMAGTTNETISRMLGDFKEEQLIEKLGSNIHMLSVEKLKKVKQ